MDPRILYFFPKNRKMSFRLLTFLSRTSIILIGGHLLLVCGQQMKHFVLHVTTIMEEKNMKKLLALLLAFVLVFSLFPVTAFAKPKPPAPPKPPVEDPKDPPSEDPPSPDPDPTPDPSEDKKEEKKKERIVYIHDPNVHTFSGYGFDTKYHWLECACGCKISMERHVDPKSTTDDVCTCGYQFSDNADLSVLWIDGAFPINNFNKDVTEYEVKAHTYKEFKEAKISTFTYDSEATVEYPKDLTLKAGKNVFEIKVTAENQKVTKTYTVTVVK